MNTQPLSHPVSLTRNWDMMLRTRSAAVHLTHAADPDTLTSTNILLDRTPIVEGGEPMLRDTLLVLTTVHRAGAYESLAGVLVRQQFPARTVLLHPRTVTLLDRTEATLTADALGLTHEDTLRVLAARYSDEPGFRDRFTMPALTPTA